MPDYNPAAQKSAQVLFVFDFSIDEPFGVSAWLSVHAKLKGFRLSGIVDSAHDVTAQAIAAVDSARA
ncbi:MAG TPA: hypothetical protein VIY86_00460 [Pirellulaceae bacterium]